MTKIKRSGGAVTLKKADSGFGKRLKDYGKWKERTDADRFLIIVYLTAPEKQAAAQRYFGNPDVCYIDGGDMQDLTLKPSAVEEYQHAPDGETDT